MEYGEFQKDINDIKFDIEASFSPQVKILEELGYKKSIVRSGPGGDFYVLRGVKMKDLMRVSRGVDPWLGKIVGYNQFFGGYGKQRELEKIKTLSGTDEAFDQLLEKPLI